MEETCNPITTATNMQGLNAAPLFAEVRLMQIAIDTLLTEASIAHCCAGFINKIVLWGFKN